MIKIKVFYKFIIILIITLIIISLKTNDFLFEIQELINYNSQSLTLLIPSNKKCHCPYKTLYFTSNQRNQTIIDNLKIIKLKLNKYHSNYFVNCYINNFNYYVHYNLLNNNGLLNSKTNYWNQNLIIDDSIYYDKTTNYKVKNISKNSKVYQYINGNTIFKKDNLYKFYKSMKKKNDNEFHYMPETFYYPKEKYLIENKFKNYSLDLKDLWLVKPTNKYGGKGIFILNSLKEINNTEYTEYIITKYIMNLDLIEKKKYDLRLYVLISGLKPLRIYFNKQGLVRRASENFSLNISTIENKFIHLTNTDINRKSKNYIYPNSSNDEKAYIWNLDTYKKYLNNKKIDWNNIYEKIKDIIIKTIISVQQKIIDKNDELNLKDYNFYNLLGFDMLITDKFEPILLEVNYSPCMNIYNKVDISIKTNLLTDILNIVGIIPFSKKDNNKLDKDYSFKNDIDELINNALCELNRPRGDLELIFPLKKNIKKYKKYFNKISDENERFWKILLNLN